MKHEREQCSYEIKLRVTPTVGDAIERAASDEGHSLSNMTRRILKSWAAQRDEDAAA